MKKLSTSILACLMFSIIILQSGCFGQFQLVKAVYNWNDDISQDKFVKTLFFWVLNIIPVYGIAGFIDAVILNVIEFWSGSNPMSMKDGETEMQLVKYRGNDYQITASKNKMTVEQLTGVKKGALVDLVYTPDNQTWTIESNDQKIKVAKYLRNHYNQEVWVVFYQPNGETVTVPFSDEGMAMIRMFRPNEEVLVMN